MQSLCCVISAFLFALRYTEKANSVQQEETVLSIGFVTLDCSPLKSSLVQHCSEWQTKLTELLRRIASTRLKELHAFLHESANRWEVKSKDSILFIKDSRGD